MTGHLAFLRVYEPLVAFDSAERQRWEAYLAASTAPDTTAGPELERVACLRALAGRTGSPLPVLPDHAYVTEVDGVTLLCPWSTRLRSLEALEDFLADVPGQLVEAWVPRAAADGVSEQLVAWRRAHPGERAHQVCSTWHVPLRWFVLVDPVERAVQLGSGPSGVRSRLMGRSLVYRTPMSRARRRVARALAVLRSTVEGGTVLAGLEDLGRWLEEFHPRSLVELDYGGLVHLLDDAELSSDESARDVALVLAALAEGNAERAAVAYERVSARMKALQAVDSAN
ncbi:MAG: hypothetical protein WD794_07085 [Mycobacteriales bacterium]